ncbi:MAG: aromatic amino acid exporter YddG [Paracoccaceae bacterium]
MTRPRATLIGFSAVLLWSLLALFTVNASSVPPLQLNAICLTVGGMIGLIWSWRSGTISRLKAISWKVYAFGTAGLFGYHFLYFSALQSAPAAEAGLIAYLWPLLIVLFSGLLPGETLRRGHIFGALISFGGAAIVVTGTNAGFDPAHLPGYIMAIGCALTWSLYSVVSRWLGNVPTASVTVFCLLSALLSFFAHLAFETTNWPASSIGWISIAALGLGPVGIAFYVWDFGLKNGNIQLLGVASYAAPLLSTIALVVAGITEPRWSLLLAAIFISAGALWAATASKEIAGR